MALKIEFVPGSNALTDQVRIEGDAEVLEYLALQILKLAYNHKVTSGSFNYRVNRDTDLLFKKTEH